MLLDDPPVVTDDPPAVESPRPPWRMVHNNGRMAGYRGRMVHNNRRMVGYKGRMVGGQDETVVHGVDGSG